MQTISTTALDIFKQGHLVGVTIACEGLDGNITLTQNDIVLGSFSLDRNCVSGSNIEIGNVEISELSFNLDNFDGRYNDYRFEGAVLTVDLIVGAEYLRIGKFIVDVIPRKKSILTISALDYMAKFDKYWTGTTLGGVTLITILNQACTACGVTLYSQTFTNGDYVCPVVAETDDLTWRQIVSWIAELAGCNAWIDQNGELRLTWYGESQGTTDIAITSSERRKDGYQMDENSITLSGVVYQGEDADVVVGTTDYAIVIEGNDLLDPEDATTVLTAIYNKIDGFFYTPFEFTTCCLPHVWPMDELTISDSKGDTVTSYVMKHKFTLNGLSGLAAIGESVTRSGWASIAPFTKRQAEIIRSIARNTTPDLTAYDQAVLGLNAAMANAHGFYLTVVTDPLTDAKTYYYHDASTLETSTVIYMQAETGLAWTDQGWNSGNPSWQYGFTSTGNMVIKTVSTIGLNAAWIITGTIASALNESWLNLTDGTFSFGNGDLTYGETGLEVQGIIHAQGGDIGGWTIDGTEIYVTDKLYLNSSGWLEVWGATKRIRLEDGRIRYYEYIDSAWVEVFAGANAGIYVQASEPTAQTNELWIDTDDYSRYDVQTVTADTTLTLGSAEVVLGSGSGTDITLPSATQAGMIFKVFNVDATNSITVQYSGMTTKTLTAGQSADFISTGSTWVYGV